MAPKEGPPEKRFRFDNVDTITVLVGANGVKFVVHEDVLIRRSDFFRAACLGKFKEGHEKTIHLLEMSADVFKSYAHWAYTGNVVLEEDDDNADVTTNNVKIRYSLVLLYCAADLLIDQRLRNAVIDRLIKLQEDGGGYPDSLAVNCAYKWTPEGSTLRKLFVDYWLNWSDAQYFKDNGNTFARAFLFDLVHGRMANNNAKTPVPSMKNKCKYHEHDRDVPKCTS